MEEIMTGKLHKTVIKERTEEYWEQHKDDDGCDVEELIGRELTYAHNHPLDDDTPRLRPLDKPVHTLALTVGESFEPLLQVTSVPVSYTHLDVYKRQRYINFWMTL